MSLDRTCHAHECEAPCPATTGFCSVHWNKLPAAAQRIVVFHRGAARLFHATKVAVANDALAMRIAAVLIAFTERRWSQRHCMDQIADASRVAQRAGVNHRDIDTTVRAIGWERIVEGHGAGEGKQLELGGAGSGRGRR